MTPSPFPISQCKGHDAIRRAAVKTCELRDRSLRLIGTRARRVLECGTDWQEWRLVVQRGEHVSVRAGTACTRGRNRIFFLVGGDVEGNALNGTREID